LLTDTYTYRKANKANNIHATAIVCKWNLRTTAKTSRGTRSQLKRNKTKTRLCPPKQLQFALATLSQNTNDLHSNIKRIQQIIISLYCIHICSGVIQSIHCRYCSICSILHILCRFFLHLLSGWCRYIL